ncbi:MAG: 2-C-methyl-D-erythritol 4-phosphate cytidylyltransferase [Verrucomicrobiae bacterium]|nr:2-C-methyl-D-erythritol 4-phosphate cytidylyltransferase [Verrucomicrobiae bacterium]
MITAVIVAAGSSRRMGFDKLFTPLLGRPVIAHTLENFQNCAAIDEIAVVTRPERFTDFEDLKKQFSLDKVRHLVEGGAERQDSVLAGVKTARNRAELVAIHDGARPLCTPEMIEKTIGPARSHGASVAACKIVDTLKEADDRMGITRTVDRSRLWAVQTPQTFRTELILRAYETVMARGVTVTDDTAAVELLGEPVVLVDTGRANLKITTPEDLVLAGMLLEARLKSTSL